MPRLFCYRGGTVSALYRLIPDLFRAPGSDKVPVPIPSYALLVEYIKFSIFLNDQ